jgi:hypothetical protein
VEVERVRGVPSGLEGIRVVAQVHALLSSACTANGSYCNNETAAVMKMKLILGADRFDSKWKSVLPCHSEFQNASPFSFYLEKPPHYPVVKTVEQQ